MWKQLSMAADAYSQSRGLATLAKRLRNYIPSGISAASFSLRRRGLHESVYDKNPDDVGVQPKVVPDEVVIQAESEEYWEPDPQTGLFGPAGEISEDTTGLHSSAANASEDSVLEQKAFFRPLDDLDKPPPPSSF